MNGNGGRQGENNPVRGTMLGSARADGKALTRLTIEESPTGVPVLPPSLIENHFSNEDTT